MSSAEPRGTRGRHGMPSRESTSSRVRHILDQKKQRLRKMKLFYRKKSRQNQVPWTSPSTVVATSSSSTAVNVTNQIVSRPNLAETEQILAQRPLTMPTTMHSQVWWLSNREKLATAITIYLEEKTVAPIYMKINVETGGSIYLYNLWEPPVQLGALILCSERWIWHYYKALKSYALTRDAISAQELLLWENLFRLTWVGFMYWLQTVYTQSLQRTTRTSLAGLVQTTLSEFEQYLIEDELALHNWPYTSPVLDKLTQLYAKMQEQIPKMADIYEKEQKPHHPNPRPLLQIFPELHRWPVSFFSVQTQWMIPYHLERHLDDITLQEKCFMTHLFRTTKNDESILGKGAYGVVRQSHPTEDILNHLHMSFAAKFVETKQPVQKYMFVHESILSQAMGRAGVGPRCMGTLLCDKGNTGVMMMERLTGTTLDPKKIQLQREDWIRVFAKIHLMHRQGIIHRDLHVNNIFALNPISEEFFHSFRILDFGLSIQIMSRKDARKSTWPRKIIQLQTFDYVRLLFAMHMEDIVWAIDYIKQTYIQPFLSKKLLAAHPTLPNDMWHQTMIWYFGSAYQQDMMNEQLRHDGYEKIDMMEGLLLEVLPKHIFMALGKYAHKLFVYKSAMLPSERMAWEEKYKERIARLGVV